MAKAKSKLKSKPKTAAKAKSKPAAKKAAAKNKGGAMLRTVTPHLICAGAAQAIEFYKKAFAATVVMRLDGSDGKVMHACVQIGDSAVMLADEFPSYGALGPKALKGTPVTIHLVVDDADKFAARAVRAGAIITMPIANMFWGDRYGQIEDPFGHRWAIAHHVRDVSVAEMRKTMPKM